VLAEPPPPGEHGRRWRALAAGAGVGQPGQGDGDRRRAARLARRRAASPPRPRCPTSSRTGRPCWTTPGSRRRRWWRRPGWPPWPTTPGLEVDALGAPGVYSARYAGEDVTYADNVAKLLSELDARPTTVGRGPPASARWRWWRFPTARAVGRGRGGRHDRPAGPGERRLRLRPGLRARRRWWRTFAEMTPEAKHAISHRGRAFRALAAALDRTRRR
jgi:hypothetical protein